MITHPRTEELAESVRLWIDEIRPTLDPRNAFLARVAANAMATIVRELTQGPAADAEAVGEAHREVFSGIRPASTVVVVGGLLDPRWKVEIEMEAVLGS